MVSPPAASSFVSSAAAAVSSASLANATVPDSAEAILAVAIMSASLFFIVKTLRFVFYYFTGPLPDKIHIPSF